MLVSEFMYEVNDALRGTDDDPPQTGTDEYLYWLRLYNRIKRQLYRDVKKQWNDSFDIESVGTIAIAAEPVFNLPETFIAASDFAYIIGTDGNRTDLEIVKPQERNSRVRQLYLAGQNPKKLVFSNAILTGETIIGGTLYLPGYWMPADLSDDDEVLNVPDADYGVLAVAAEVAFNDITYEDKAPDIQTKANRAYDMMIANNSGGLYGRPRKSKSGVPNALRRGRY